VKFVQIDDRVIDLESGQVHHRGEVTQLPPRLLTLLNYFVENGSRVLSRDDLIEGVWGHLEAATDDSVNVAVSALRRAIGDDRRPHRVLKAVPRRGYLFESDAWQELDDEKAAAPIASEAAPAAGPEPRPAASRRPVRVGLVALVLAAVAGLAWLQPWRGSDSTPGTGQELAASTGRSVAVLPFADMSTAGNQGAFADGLVDRIIHMLTLSPELAVVARTSSFAFRDTDAGIGQIAEKLDVETVLEGSVQHSADQVRVLAQLIDAKTEKHIWSRSYDRPLGELFALQDEIANEVARTLTDTLLPVRDTRHADSQKVWELVTRGRLALDLFTLESATEASEHFRQALELQPDSVEALVGMVDALSMQRSLGPYGSSAIGEDITEPYLQRARRLAPDSAMVARITADWHFNNARPDEAISEYRRAIGINPNAARAHRKLGRVLFRQTRYDDALEPLRTAARLDPFSGLGKVWLADAYWAVGRAEEALFRLRQAIEDLPDFPQAHDRLATYLAQTGETGRAMRHILHARKLDPDSPRRWFRVCEFWLQLGDDAQAERCTNALLDEHDLPHYGRYLRQIIHSFRGEWEANQRELEAIYATNQRDPLTRTLLAQSYSRTDCPLALEILGEFFPELFTDRPEVNPTLVLAVKTGVYCMQKTGDANQAELLFKAFSGVVARTRNERGPWLVSGIEPAWVHALNNDYDAAIQALEELVAGDWRYYWWGLESYPSFAPIVDDPRFIKLDERLREGVRRQREWFEANRDQPLN
jgi:TolB-like protein/DNA-binding winged helix-turn-helix (wHTH) protein/Tfp pilus assembly protein PilF